MSKIQRIFFLPPMATARLGGSDTPLESFTWIEDPTLHGGGKTVIAPTTSLEVLQDGSVRPYLPTSITFRDGNRLRPTAPFFELHYREEGSDRIKPLTLDVLEKNGGSIGGITYTITASNRKAARRTGDASCAYTARIQVDGDDFGSHRLLASSLGDNPMVFPDRPIPLGSFQAIRPAKGELLDVNLDVVRVRFTPARGQVYGPPSAIDAIEPEFPTMQRRYELVPPENRILNQNSPWVSFSLNDDRFNNPAPDDTYDGADDDARNNQSYGVVDDTCDVLIEAVVVVGRTRHRALARVFSGPPDYAPDRRPFLSLADEFLDRDGPPANQPAETQIEALDRLADLFQRVFETVSLANVDAMRDRAVTGGQDGGRPSDSPRTDDASMTKADRRFMRKDIDLVGPPTGEERLPFAEMGRTRHEFLIDAEYLATFLRDNAGLVRHLIRPPWGAFKDLEKDPRPSAKPNSKHRDPRIVRDTLHDMRMPPYMRDSDADALSLTRHQYEFVMEMVKRLAATKAGPPETRAQAHVEQVVKRRKQQPKRSTKVSGPEATR